jgi:hypothetical protein
MSCTHKKRLSGRVNVEAPILHRKLAALVIRTLIPAFQILPTADGEEIGDRHRYIYRRCHAFDQMRGSNSPVPNLF